MFFIVSVLVDAHLCNGAFFQRPRKATLPSVRENTDGASLYACYYIYVTAPPSILMCAHSSLYSWETHPYNHFYAWPYGIFDTLTSRSSFITLILPPTPAHSPLHSDGNRRLPCRTGKQDVDNDRVHVQGRCPMLLVCPEAQRVSSNAWGR